MNIVDTFYALAERWHNNIGEQKRKYTGEVYTVHTKNVAELYRDFAPLDSVGIAAAHGHDLLEDCRELGLTAEKLAHEAFQLTDKPHLVNFVIPVILDLTDVFTSQAHPNINRAARKKAERERLAKIRPAAQNIKICDLMDNTSSIVKHDPDFARVYLDEKIELLLVLRQADIDLRRRAFKQAAEGLVSLGLTPKFNESSLD